MMTGDVCFRGRYRHPIPRTSRRLLTRSGRGATRHSITSFAIVRECRWQLEVDRLGGHEIDHQFDFGRPGHGQDRRFGTFENADHGGFLRFRPWRSFSFSPELLIAVVSAGPAVLDKLNCRSERMLNAWAVVQREQCFRRKDTPGHLHWSERSMNDAKGQVPWQMSAEFLR